MKRQKHKARTFRLSEDAHELIEAMAGRLGLSLTAILELAIREKAATMNVTVPPPDPSALPHFGGKEGK